MNPSSHERIEELREQVEEQQQELHVALEELETAARRTFDVRRWIRANPALWIGGAILVGVALGARWAAAREAQYR